MNSSNINLEPVSALGVYTFGKLKKTGLLMFFWEGSSHMAETTFRVGADFSLHTFGGYERGQIFLRWEVCIRPELVILNFETL